MSGSVWSVRLLSLEPGPYAFRATRRIAILHYSGEPAVGGIEHLITQQCDVLRSFGHDVVCLLGSGRDYPGVETILLPLLDPANEQVKAAMSQWPSADLYRDHPLVQSLVDSLQRSLKGCTDCWLHNALTVSLHPFLAEALRLLIERRRDLHWVVWCEDISSGSRFVAPSHQRTSASLRAARDLVTWVTISHARANELSTVLGVLESVVRVIRPPLDVLTWLDVGDQTRSIVGAVGAFDVGPVVLVPAKALPHKGLSRAVAVGRKLAADDDSTRILITAAPSPHEPRRSESLVEALRAEIRQSQVQNNVFLLTDLLEHVPTSRTIRELIQLCDVLLLPSIEEGFGLPMLEAAALRLPVVCTDIPVFREVGGVGPRYFHPQATDEEVAFLVRDVARTGNAAARRSAVASMSTFRTELRQLLAASAYPNV